MRETKLEKGDIIELKTPYEIETEEGSDKIIIDEKTSGIIFQSQENLNGDGNRSPENYNFIYFDNKHKNFIEHAGIPERFLYVKTKHLKKLTKRDDKQLPLRKIFALRKIDAIRNVVNIHRQEKQNRVDVTAYQNDLQNAMYRLNSSNIQLKESIEKIDEDNINIDNIKIQFEKLKKHEKVESIEYVDEGVVISTTGLTHYHDEKEELNNIYLGKYKILIPFTANNYSQIKIVNAEKSIMKNNYHPCITTSTNCLGHTVGNELDRLLQEEMDIFLIGSFLINFIERPNYGTPFISIQYFQASQDTEYAPENVMDYFKYDYSSHLKWDTDVYNEKVKTLDIAEEEGEDICGNCGHHVDDCQCCPECGEPDCGWCDECERSSCTCICDEESEE